MGIADAAEELIDGVQHDRSRLPAAARSPRRPVRDGALLSPSRRPRPRGTVRRISPASPTLGRAPQARACGGSSVSGNGFHRGPHPGADPWASTGSAPLAHFMEYGSGKGSYSNGQTLARKGATSTGRSDKHLGLSANRFERLFIQDGKCYLGFMPARSMILLDPTSRLGAEARKCPSVKRGTGAVSCPGAQKQEVVSDRPYCHSGSRPSRYARLASAASGLSCARSWSAKYSARMVS